MNKQQLLDEAVTAQQTIEELKSDIVVSAMQHVLTEVMLLVMNEFKGDTLANHMRHITQMLVPAVVFIYCLGMQSRKTLNTISTYFVYEPSGTASTILPSKSSINGMAFKELHPAGN